MGFDDFDDFDSFSDFERWDYFYGDDGSTSRRGRYSSRLSGSSRLTEDEIKRIRQRGDQLGMIGGVMVIVMVVILILGLFWFLVS